MHLNLSTILSLILFFNFKVELQTNFLMNDNQDNLIMPLVVSTGDVKTLEDYEYLIPEKEYLSKVNSVCEDAFSFFKSPNRYLCLESESEVIAKGTKRDNLNIWENSHRRLNKNTSTQKGVFFIKNDIIKIKNTSKFSYKDRVISLSWRDLKEKNRNIEVDNFKIVDAKSKMEIPYQLEYRGCTEIQNLLLQITLAPNSQLELLIKKGKHANVETKTYGRYVPERLDDFAWENDKIAFRMYGKALEEGGVGNAYGIDVWVKRTERMIINERYKRGEYHVDHGDGMDYYHVGLTLGAGNIAPYENDSIWYSKNYTKWKILDNGPLRTTFQLEFDEWAVNGKKIKAIKTISLDAGSQLNKIDVKYTSNDETLKRIPVVIGIIKRPENGSELMDIENGVMGYWEPQHGDDGTTGVGVIIPSEVSNMQVRNDQYLAMLEISNNETFTYYTGAAWDKAGIITSDKQWFDFLKVMHWQLLDEGIIISY